MTPTNQNNSKNWVEVVDVRVAIGCEKIGWEFEFVEKAMDDHHSAAATGPVKSLVTLGVVDGAGSPAGRTLVNEPEPTLTIVGSVG